MSDIIEPVKMKYCVIGNIIREHLDEEGIIRYGTIKFPPGRKVYKQTSLGRFCYCDGTEPFQE